MQNGRSCKPPNFLPGIQDTLSHEKLVHVQSKARSIDRLLGATLALFKWKMRKDAHDGISCSFNRELVNNHGIKHDVISIDLVIEFASEIDEELNKHVIIQLQVFSQHVDADPGRHGEDRAHF